MRAVTSKRRKTYSGPVQAVVFDWAGTVVDHGCMAPTGVFVRAFAAHDLTVTIEQARGPMGVDKKTHVATLLELPAVRAQFERGHGRAPAGDDLDRIYADVVRLQVDCIVSFSDPIPGSLETIAWLRDRGIKIGSCTGYVTEMMEALVPAAAAKGYRPDAWVCSSDVPSGRPAPHMALANLVRLDVSAVQGGVKVGDTVTDVEEGLNAGMWSVGVAMTGNEIGLSADDLAALDAGEREKKRARAIDRLAGAGAHYVIDGVADLPPVVEDIERRLAAGERP
jgi:phosphonoacetaldehyde hydrolase